MAQANQPQSIGLAGVHGAGLGAWIWTDTAAALRTPFLATDFPKRDGSLETRKNLGLDDYAQDICSQIDAWQVDKVILVAHSLGGVVALKVAERLGDRLVGFIGVGAAIPKQGGSFVSSLPFPKNIIVSAIMRLSGTMPPASAIKQGLCNDLSEEQSKTVVERFVPESASIYTSKTNVGVPAVPTAYIKLLQDKEFGTALQDTMAANLGTTKIIELNCGHMPMLAKPKELAETLDQLAKQLA